MSKRSGSVSAKAKTRSPRSPSRRVALVLQGRGVVAAYHVGVYQALQEEGMEPDWVVGSGFGALNAAIIAGNPLDRRLSTLNELWALIEQKSPVDTSSARRLEVPDLGSIGEGIPGLFVPNINAALGPDISVEQASLYTFDPLLDLTWRYADFASINDRRTRLSLGTVNARSGNLTFFDSNHSQITPSHVMASLALPPFFPAIELDGNPYWSAELIGTVSLGYVVNDEWSQAEGDSVVFAIVPGNRVWKEVPKTLREVLAQRKNIRDSYGNRVAVDNLIRLWEHKELRAAPVKRKSAKMDLLVLRAPSPEGGDYEDYVAFTSNAIAEYRRQGYLDVQRTLKMWREGSSRRGKSGFSIWSA